MFSLVVLITQILIFITHHLKIVSPFSASIVWLDFYHSILTAQFSSFITQNIENE